MSPAQGTVKTAGIPHTLLETSLIEPFTVPRSMDSADRVASMRSLLEEPIGRFTQETESEEVRKERALFIDAFKHEFRADGPQALGAPFDLEDEAQVAGSLFDQVAGLALEGRNGVWARLIENSFAPIFAGRFEIVVGNPPWLTFGKLPAGWRSKSETVWRSAGLWQPPGGGRRSFSFQDSDIAALVFAVSLMKYAAPNAIVGLLVPTNLISGDKSGQAFRQFHLKPSIADKHMFFDHSSNVHFAPVYVDDWAPVNPFAGEAANSPIFLVTRRDCDPTFPVPATRWQRAAAGIRMAGVEEWLGPNGMRLRLKAKDGAYSPILQADTTSVWSFNLAGAPALVVAAGNDYTFGKGLDTRGANGVYFVHVSKLSVASGSNKKALARVVNDKKAGRNAALRI